MNVENLIKHPEYSNYVCVYIGLTYAGQSLETYTRNGLQEVYRKIYTSLSGNPPCRQQCKAVGNNTTSWCKSCKDWRKMLITFHAHGCKDVDWTDQDPWKWPLAYENIATVFVKMPGTSGGSVKLRDLSNACSMWKRCKVFKLKPVVLKNVKRCRNEFFGHNDTLRVTDNDKSKVFDSLRDLIRDQDVQPFINCQECLNELIKIEQGDKITMAIAEINKEIRKIINAEDKTTLALDKITQSLGVTNADTEMIKDQQANITVSVKENKQVLGNLTQTLHEVNSDAKLLKYYHEDLNKDQKSTRETVNLLYERQSQESIDMKCFHDVTLSKLREINERTNKTTLMLSTFATLICAIVFLVISFKKSDTLRDLMFNMNSGDTANRFRHIYSKCLSEAYTYPFRQDLPLLGYLPTQNELIGREWALEILEQKLVTENTNSRGVLMTADYGFGKSAIVAHLLCVGENMKGWNIRKHIVAFHVCKFNVGVTKSPARLIKRLIGFLSMKSAEYGQYITLHEYSLIFNENDCEKNIDACFDQAVTIPLETLTPPDDAPWIIAIDALDECLKPDGANPILELLSTHMVFVQQKGRKWFRWIVTSRQMSSLTSLRKFDIVDFKSSDQRNTNDIYQLIISYFPSAHNYLQLARSFAVNSGGNVLYVRLALEYALQTKKLSLPYLLKLPVTMDEIYELNFDRLFDNNDDFQTAKPILEIICIGQLSLSRIFEILTENGVANQTHLEKAIDKLSFFIMIDNFVTFRHRSLHDWLRNNTKYKTSIVRGHAMLATYMLNSLIPDKHFDEETYILKLVYHVAKSEDTNLFNKFKSRNFTHFQEAKERLNKFEGVKSFFDRQGENSKKSLELILDFMNKTIHKDIAYVILENIYVMSRDNLDTFKFLFEKVSHLKQSFLLHGAAERCTTDEIARYLIFEVNQSALLEDVQGRRPSDIACLYGCINVLKLIAEKDNSVVDMQCLYRSLFFGKQSFDTILNKVEFHLSCHRRRHIDIQREYYKFNFFVEQYRDQDPALENLQDIFTNSALHVLVYSHSEFYTQKTPSEICRIQDSLMCEKIINILISTYFRSWPHSEGQIPSELNEFDHYFYIENRDKRVRHSNSFKAFVDKYPKILSCPDIQGFTPALLIVVLNKNDLLSEVLEHAMKDRCQKVSPVMVYIFWYITERHRCVLFTKYPHYRWCWYRRKFSCPTHASFEHLLMRYERARMIDLVIANGYTLDWNKKDIHGKTPLDYAQPDFIKQLENHFGVNIQVLSDKERLVQSCILDWSYFVLAPYMCSGVCVVIGMYVLTYYSILNVVFFVFLSFHNSRQTF